MSGRELLERHGWTVRAIVQIESLDGGTVTVREE